MDEKKNATVEWFVNFAQMDLERLSPGDRAKLEVEAGEYLLPSIPIPILKDEKRSDYLIDKMRNIDLSWIWENHETVKKSPSESKSQQKHDWFTHVPEKHTEEYWSLIVDCEKNVYDALKGYLDGKIVGNQSVSHAFYCFLARERFEFMIIPMMKKHSDFVIIKLNMALDGLPVACLQTCQSCRRIFFNPSKRTMKYCSTKCLWRFNTQKRRTAMGIGYKPQQENLQRVKRVRDLNKKMESKARIRTKVDK
jgi:hypothetical protein